MSSIKFSGTPVQQPVGPDLPNFSFYLNAFVAQPLNGAYVLPPVGVARFEDGKIGAAMFYGQTRLTSLTLPEGFASLTRSIVSMFYGCSKLVMLNFNSDFGANVKTASGTINAFNGLAALTSVTGAPKCAANMSFSDSTLLTHDSLMNIINGLTAVTTSTTLTLGTTNLAKLADDEKKIATDKGWTLV